MKHPVTRAPHRAVALILLAFGVAACNTPGGGNVTGAEAHALVAQGATLVDVRSSGEWQSGHIEGAVHIPVEEISTRMSELPRDHTIVVYCASGMRSARAATALRSAGYEVRDLGPMSNWN
jgi:phage shock protein E